MARNKVATSKELVNPFSTGGGGSTFESRVGAAFVALMLSGGRCPCVSFDWPISSVCLQNRYKGYEIDDILVETVDNEDGGVSRLVCQVKHTISITEKDPQFGQVIHAAWKDFHSPNLFAYGRDAFALVTGPISKVDRESVCRLLEFARGSAEANEFYDKLRLGKFVSDDQRKKFRVFEHLIQQSIGNSPDRTVLWKFLKSFHLIGFDADLQEGVSLSLIHSLIRARSLTDPKAVWGMIVKEVQQKAIVSGTITRRSVSQEICRCFDMTQKQPIFTKAPPRMRETLALNLIGGWDENSNGDRSAVERLAGMSFPEWQSKVREIWRGQGQ